MRSRTLEYIIAPKNNVLSNQTNLQQLRQTYAKQLAYYTRKLREKFQIVHNYTFGPHFNAMLVKATPDEIRQLNRSEYLVSTNNKIRIAKEQRNVPWSLAVSLSDDGYQLMF